MPKRVISAELRKFLVEIAGEYAPPIVDAIKKPKSDEQLAEICNIKVSEVRATLNKLHILGIATYDRTRDEETGWYSYVWNVNLSKAYELMEMKQKKEAEKRIVPFTETVMDFYMCKNCIDFKIQFDQAMDYLFKCPKCNSDLVYFENVRKEKKP
ncbi:MAG: hypothetical protein QXP42_01040 [Candidatus Micrarchaeia archaeon]